MTAARVELDVRRLPTTVFSHRSHMWWGTLGFMLIEGTTLFVCVSSYYYLRTNFTSWPPAPTLPPDLLLPTIHVLLMVASNVPAVLADRAARRFDLAGVRRWMIVLSVLVLVFAFLRWQDLRALNVRWDTNAYGSIAWVTVAAHGTILLLQAVETVVFTGFLLWGAVEEKHFSDTSDSVFYWFFFTGSWVVLYITVYLSPYLLP